MQLAYDVFDGTYLTHGRMGTGRMGTFYFSAELLQLPIASRSQACVREGEATVSRIPSLFESDNTPRAKSASWLRSSWVRMNCYANPQNVRRRTIDMQDERPLQVEALSGADSCMIRPGRRRPIRRSFHHRAQSSGMRSSFAVL